MNQLAEYQVSIVRTKRRTLAMVVKPNGVLEVRAPLRSAEETIETFLLKNEPWIIARLKEQRQRMAEMPRHQFKDGEEFWFMGERYGLEIVERQPKPLVLRVKFLLHSASAYRARALFEQWYRAEARAYIADRIKFYSSSLPAPKTVRITGATTRWGSCSPEGNVNFCWRLVMAPVPVINYVIIHELAHLEHANHGKRFWGLVAKLDPEWKSHRQWLHKEGHLLSL